MSKKNCEILHKCHAAENVKYVKNRQKLETFFLSLHLPFQFSFLLLLVISQKCMTTFSFKNFIHTGALETSARWIRNFVMTHELYKGDSVVPEGTVYDLLKRVAEISSGKTSDPRHLFSHVNRSSGKIPEALSSAEAFLEEKLKSTNSGGSVNSDTSLSNGSAKEGHNSEIGL